MHLAHHDRDQNAGELLDKRSNSDVYIRHFSTYAAGCVRLPLGGGGKQAALISQF
jgi:hypothetical protein